MATKKESIVSAQVVLRPASGRSLKGASITAANVHEFAPSPQAVTHAKRVFADAGFEMGDMVGNSFSITAPESTFERVFGTRGAGSLELPLHALPKTLTDLVEAVTFTPPPDFGPTSFS